MHTNDKKILAPFQVLPLDLKKTKKIETTITPISYLRQSQLIQLQSHLVKEKSFEFIPSKQLLKQLTLINESNYSALYVKVEDESEAESEAEVKRFFQHAVTIPVIDSTIWSVFYIAHNFNYKSITQQQEIENNQTHPMLASFTKAEFLKNCSDLLNSLDLKTYKHDFTISLTPPKLLSTSSINLASVDPQEYLGDKYFTSLYRNTIPIQYFTKTSLPKVHILAHDNLQLVAESIRKFILKPISIFDERHINISGDMGAHHSSIKDHLLNNVPFSSSIEKSYREDFLENSQVLYKSNLKIDDIEKLLSNLKIREAKLQILLSLELLKILNLQAENLSSPDKEKLKECNQDNNKINKPIIKKRRLVGRKKRLIPTLIGTAISSDLHFTTDLRNKNNKQLEESSNVLTATELQSNIKLFFDRLCVWDAISGISAKDDQSVYAFLVNCVVPYYEKVHTKLLKELVSKAKGPSATHKLKEEKRKRKLERLEKRLKKENRVNSEDSSGKRVLELSPIKLRRTISNLQTTDFNKKTFDMISTASFSQVSSQPQHQQSESQLLNLKTDLLSLSAVHDRGIFTQGRKRKLGVTKRVLKPPSPSRPKSITEVEATPGKNHKRSREIELSPSASRKSPFKTLIMATPSKDIERQRKREVVITSSSPEKPLVSATPSKSEYMERQRTKKITINSSPFTETKTNSKPVRRERSERATFASSPIHETPVKERPTETLLVDTPLIIDSSPARSPVDYATSSPIQERWANRRKRPKIVIPVDYHDDEEEEESDDGNVSRRLF